MLDGFSRSEYLHCRTGYMHPYGSVACMVYCVRMECCHYDLACAHNTQEARGVATGSVTQGVILPGMGPWGSAFSAHTLCYIVQHHDATPITQPNVLWMQHHARQANAPSCTDSMSCSKERPLGQKFTKQALIPRCTPCMANVQLISNYNNCV